MPTIKDFGAFRICMYFEDENPPHFHIVAPDFQAKVNIDTFDLMVGDAPGNVLSQALAWAREHRQDLQELWNTYSG
ncbi:MAG: DUF4160 domain-containing protein [Rhodospirillales bacterium]|nr:DUF4160 domain-containing protein [Rhodospirillales bacterium]